MNLGEITDWINKEEKKALDEINGIESMERTELIKDAKKIAQGAKTHANGMYRNGWEVRDDFSPDERFYESSRTYQWFYDGILRHLEALKDIAERAGKQLVQDKN